MPSHEEIYKDLSYSYDDMIMRQPDLTPYIKEIRPFQGLDVLDLGAGSGRLSSILSLEASTLICTDKSRSMLDILDKKLESNPTSCKWNSLVADHRELPVKDSTIDLVVSGWSICYLANTNNKDWEENLDLIMAELRRVLKPNGMIIIFETLGTGYESPNPPDFLTFYYSALENKYGFSHRWIRMDYPFSSPVEAKNHVEFFFGPEISRLIDENQWSTVPECAGIWWRHI